MPRFALLCLTLLSALVTASARPNLLWIVVDDMSADFSCYGETLIETPHVDRLAGEGTKFTRAFVTSPVCSSSRTAMITGCYQTTIGAHHHRSGRGKHRIQLLLGVCFLREAPERAIGSDRRAGKRGFFSETPGLSEAARAEEFIFKGFYPRIYDRNLNPREAYSFYLSTYLERDVRQMTQVADLSAFEHFLRLCAGRSGQLLNLSAVSNELGVTHPTIRRWLSILEASHIVKLLQPWHANLGKRLVKTPKLYFIDTGLACNLLGIEEAGQLKTHPLRGALFENLIVAEALKQRFHAGRSDNLWFYRDHKGNEVDLLMEYAEQCDAFEIKSAQTINPDFFRGLDHFEALTKRIRHRHIVFGGPKGRFEKNTRVQPWSRFRTEVP